MRLGGGIGGVPARKKIFNVEEAEIVDAVRTVLCDDVAIVGDKIEKTAVVQPCAHARLAPAEGEHGMQPRRFQCRRRKDGKLQGVRLLSAQKRAFTHGGKRLVQVRLAILFDVLAAKGGKHGGSGAPHGVLIRARIAVKFGAFLPLFEAFARLLQNARAVGEFGAHEPREPFGVARKPLPPIVGEHGDVHARADELFFVIAEDGDDFRLPQFFPLREKDGTENALGGEFHRTLEGNFRLLFEGDKELFPRHRDGEGRALSRKVFDLHIERRFVKVVAVTDELRQAEPDCRRLLSDALFALCHSFSLFAASCGRHMENFSFIIPFPAANYNPSFCFQKENRQA